MTFDVNDFFGITVTHGQKKGPKHWVAEAQAFRRDTMENLGEVFYGKGTTMNTSDNDALEKAKAYVSTLKKPNDWTKH